MNPRLETLLDEYKEMRNEIRASYSVYFSILFGVILTSIGAVFYAAFSKHFLFLIIPFLISGWIGTIATITANIQHIAAYIRKIEYDINQIQGDKLLFYETSHVKRLWSSPYFLLLGLIICVPLGIVYLVSLVKGYQYLNSHDYYFFALSLRMDIIYVVSTVFLLSVVLALFFLLRRNISRFNYD